MSDVEAKVKKRKPRRKILHFAAFREKYLPLMQQEEAADREAAEKRSSGITLAESLNRDIGRLDVDLSSEDPWEQASRLAPVRILRRAVTDGDVEAVQFFVMAILTHLQVIVPDEIRTAVFRPLPKGKPGRPVEQDTQEIYRMWQEMGQPPLDELAEALYGTLFSDATPRKQRAIVKKLKKTIVRQLEAETRQLKARTAELKRAITRQSNQVRP